MDLSDVVRLFDFCWLLRIDWEWPYVIFMILHLRQKLEVKSIPSPATGTPGSLTGARTEDLRKEAERCVLKKMFYPLEV